MNRFLTKMASKGNLIQLVAYHGTGKDTLVSSLANSQYDQLGWKIFGPSKSKLFLDFSSIKRVSFADPLKKEVCSRLNLPTEWVLSGEFDRFKDLPCDECPSNVQSALKTNSSNDLREVCREVADELKMINGESYFVDLALGKIEELRNRGHTVFVTDTRYPYEIQKDAITIRLFRKEIEIPPIDIHSERSLDDYKCNFVMCKTETEFSFLKEIQTQYKNYRIQDELS